MYKNYSREDYIHCADECSARVKKLLRIRFDELEDLREAINDRYPFEDLFLKWAEIDYEKGLITELIKDLETHTKALKDRI